MLKGLRFDTGKSSIKPLSFPILDDVVAIMKKNPKLKVEIQGHTDNRGAEKYNQQLSENRARSVMEYLMGKGIEQSRLSSMGYGFSKPAASNLTEEGRAQNRRVELKPIP
jgi:OOP family OmpA-OmpF porin